MLFCIDILINIFFNDERLYARELSALFCMNTSVCCMTSSVNSCPETNYFSKPLELPGLKVFQVVPHCATVRHVPLVNCATPVYMHVSWVQIYRRIGFSSLRVYGVPRGHGDRVHDYISAVYARLIKFTLPTQRTHGQAR